MRLLLACAVLMFGIVASARAQPPDVVGRWRLVARFGPAEERTLRFDARAEGKGTLMLLDPTSSLNSPPEPAAARWEGTARDQIIFSGDVAFPIGNVGRDPGTLVFKGTMSSSDAITGSVGFYRQGQDPHDPATVPARAGSFTATRAKGPSGQ